MTERHAASYEALRIRVVALIQDTETARLEQIAPATPQWRVRDVFGHMVGVGDDVVNGRLDRIASDEWTAAQVDRRRDVPVGELVDEWAAVGPAFEQMLGAAPEPIAGQAVFDAVTHEHDIRQAIGCPGARDAECVGVSWDWFLGTRTQAGAPAICFVTERGEEIAGTGAPQLTVRAPSFELLRAATGRRTRAEMERFEWEPAPDVDRLIAAPFFTIRTETLGE